MSIGSNRDRINRHLQNDRFTLISKYNNGVHEFVDVATKYGLVRGKTKCPCVNFKNSWWQTIDDVIFYLYTNGFFSHYTIWTFHGDKEPRMESQ